MPLGIHYRMSKLSYGGAEMKNYERYDAEEAEHKEDLREGVLSILIASGLVFTAIYFVAVGVENLLPILFQHQ